MNITKAATYFKELGGNAGSLRATQIGLLLDIAAAGHTGISITESAKLEGVTVSTFSRKLKNLMVVFEPSLIDFIYDSADRRYKRVILSAHGREVIGALFTAFGNSKGDARLGTEEVEDDSEDDSEAEFRERKVADRRANA
jgi:DNA-binding MarR family transcriptional regulator